MLDYYGILKIAPDASREAIRKAFRKSAKSSHPDLFPGDTPVEKEKRQIHFVQLTQAYEILSDHERRKQYDLQRLHHSRKTFTSKNQKRRTSTSSSFQNSSSFVKSHDIRSKSIPETEETLTELLHEFRILLDQFERKFNDPLEYMMVWATKIFNETFIDLNATEKEDGDLTIKHSSDNTSNPNKHKTSKEDKKGLDEELERIKKNNETQKEFNKDLNNNLIKDKTVEEDINRELEILKQKYKK